MTKLITVIAAALLVTAGCSQQSPLAPDNSALPASGDGDDQTFALGGEVQSAQLHLFVGFANGQPVNLHRIVADWEPASVTWNQFAGAYSADIEGSFTAAIGGWYMVDVTGLVQSWADGALDNYGLLLEQATSSFMPVTISSSENTTLAPFLEVCYSTTSGMVCDTVQPDADVFIDESQPDASSEGAGTLMVGQMMTPGSQKQALMRFDRLDIVAEVAPATVAGWVWEDVDQDGIFDADETGLAGVTVRLYDCQEALLAEAVSHALGEYEFGSLAAGDFLVEFVAPAGYLFSPMDHEPTDGLDSDADPTTGRTACFTLTEGEAAMFMAAGMYVPVVTDSGCTRSKGYWKNHAGGCRQTDEVTPLLPIWLGEADGTQSLLVDRAETAVAILSQKSCGSPSNGITKLYAQLLAAKLNIASGALADAVSDVISKADDFLTHYDQTAWETLDPADKSTVLEWKDLLDRYNNGGIGPGRCKCD